MTDTERIELEIIGARLGCTYTEEQMEFASDFTKPALSISNPGTGKSHTMVAGLILAHTLHRVPGNKINAMSFTRDATNELKMRYTLACAERGITPVVKFNTLYSICLSIIKERYPRMNIRESFDMDKDLSSFAREMEDLGEDISDMYRVKSVYEAVDSLTASFVFDPVDIKRNYKFRILHMDIDKFQELRVNWFIRGLNSYSITRGDIPIYTLYVLATNPMIQKSYQEKYRIMVVDEFQDLSLLHLKILTMITSNLVAIGDMKQQIYEFNGASQQIVDEYLKYYPSAKCVSLTKSFRCKDEIAEFATRVIRPNDRSIVAFTGVGTGGDIQVLDNHELNLDELVERLKINQVNQMTGTAVDTMFLFRNNSAMVPLAEKLYKAGVCFRMGKFSKVMDLPIFSKLCRLADIAESPKDMDVLYQVPYLFPEFKEYTPELCPLLIAIRKSRRSIFDVPYQFQEQSSIDIMNALRRASYFIEKGEDSGQVFNALFGVYDKYILKGRWFVFPYKKEYYFSLVSSIVKKTYSQMKGEELAKQNFIEECTKANMGVRCYTLHSAKGLEADDVYILDADSTIFPNTAKLSRVVNEECTYEAARIVRSERNLLYVGITRAKDRCYVCYNGDVTPLVGEPSSNQYTYLDGIYRASKKDYDNMGNFIRLFAMSDTAAASDKLPGATTYDCEDTTEDAELVDIKTL